MKKLITILSLFVVMHSYASPLAGFQFTTITNIIGVIWDSYGLDGDNTGPRVAPYSTDWWYWAVQSQHPTNYIIFSFDCRSGEIPDAFLTNHINFYTFAMEGYRSNNYDHFLFIKSTENGGSVVSNYYYTTWTAMCQAPAKMSDGSSLTLNTMTGWASTHPWKIYGMSDFASLGASGNPLLTTHGIQSSGATNATVINGAGVVDIIGHTYTVATNDNVVNNGTNYWVHQSISKDGHPYVAYHVSAFIHWCEQTLDDTNTNSRRLSWTDGSIVSTNHTVVTTSTKSGNTLTFTCKDDHGTVAWDVRTPSLNITNDGSAAFILEPGLENALFYGLQLDGLPAGHTFSLTIGGWLIGNFSTFDLSTGPTTHGLNLFTNQNTPQWSQSVEGVGRVRDYEYVNRTNLIQGSAGDGLGIVSWKSQVSVRVAAGDRGDTLLASTRAIYDSTLAAKATAVYNQAQTTNLVWQVTDLTLANAYTPAPFRR